jgi:hypothetical protein
MKRIESAPVFDLAGECRQESTTAEGEDLIKIFERPEACCFEAMFCFDLEGVELSAASRQKPSLGSLAIAAERATHGKLNFS